MNEKLAFVSHYENLHFTRFNKSPSELAKGDDMGATYPVMKACNPNLQKHNMSYYFPV